MCKSAHHCVLLYLLGQQRLGEERNPAFIRPQWERMRWRPSMESEYEISRQIIPLVYWVSQQKCGFNRPVIWQCVFLWAALSLLTNFHSNQISRFPQACKQTNKRQASQTVTSVYSEHTKKLLMNNIAVIHLEIFILFKQIFTTWHCPASLAFFHYSSILTASFNTPTLPSLKT